MKLQIQRRVNAAKAAYALGRLETDDERAAREDVERARASAEQLDQLVARSWLGCVMPGDLFETRRSSWSFATSFLRRGDE